MLLMNFLVIIGRIGHKAKVILLAGWPDGRDICAVPARHWPFEISGMDQGPTGKWQLVDGGQKGVIQGADGSHEEDAGLHVGCALALQVQAHHGRQPATASFVQSNDICLNSN